MTYKIINADCLNTETTETDFENDKNICKPLEKDCPFCGSNAYVHKWVQKFTGKVQYYVECNNNNCKARTGYSISSKVAVAKWEGRIHSSIIEWVKKWASEEILLEFNNSFVQKPKNISGKKWPRNRSTTTKVSDLNLTEEERRLIYGS